MKLIIITGQTALAGNKNRFERLEVSTIVFRIRAQMPGVSGLV